MKLTVPNSEILRADLHFAGEVISGVALAWVNKPGGSADYVTWRIYCLTDNESAFTCESGHYFHLSPGYTTEERDEQYELALADYLDRR